LICPKTCFTILSRERERERERDLAQMSSEVTRTCFTLSVLMSLSDRGGEQAVRVMTLHVSVLLLPLLEGGLSGEGAGEWGPPLLTAELYPTSTYGILGIGLKQAANVYSTVYDHKSVFARHHRSQYGVSYPTHS
jgi:hypothetical protein